MRRSSFFPMLCSLPHKARNFTDLLQKKLPQTLWASQLTTIMGTNRKHLNANRKQFGACCYNRQKGALHQKYHLNQKSRA